ncbi:MAG: hypothetical protein ACAI37_23480, partial [Chthoniobacter sp.]
MSLTADQPAPGPVFAQQSGDESLNTHAKVQQQIDTPPPAPPVQLPGDPVPPDSIPGPGVGRTIAQTDFWVTLRRARTAPPSLNPATDFGEDYAFALLVPTEGDPNLSGFYSSPANRATAAAHTLAGTAGIAAWYFDAPTQTFQPMAGNVYAAAVQWDANLPGEDQPAGTFTLQDLFDECFIADLTWQQIGQTDQYDRVASDWREPDCRRHGAPVPLTAASAEVRNARRLDQQRERIAEAALLPFDENAHQARSTAMALFLSQYVAFTETGARADANANPRPAHVTDLGLVFYGPVSELMKLENCRVLKADAPTPGRVTILNPRDTWFDRSAPILWPAGEPTAGIEGVKLNWQLDLPAARGSAESNPEQYLQHYRITRTVETHEFQPAWVETKTAATLGRQSGGEVEVTASDWQFLDNFEGRMALPPGYREAVLPRAGHEASLEAAIAWLRVLPETEALTLTYEVEALDTAGNYVTAGSFRVDLHRPQTVIRPALAELRICHRIPEDELPTSSPHPGTADVVVWLAIDDPAWNGEAIRTVQVQGKNYQLRREYRLIGQWEEVEPAGHYGSDGATSRLRSPRTLATAERAGERIYPILRPDDPDPDQIANLAEIEPDEETRRKFGIWLDITNTRSLPPGRTTAVSGQEGADRTLREFIHTRDPEEPTASRFALQTIVRIVGGSEDEILFSERVPVSVEQRVQVIPRRPRAGDLPRTATIKPEAYEWPEPLPFYPLGMGEVQVTCGLLRSRAPQEDATLNALLTGANVVGLIRDVDRRTLTTIRFAAFPAAAHDEVGHLLPGDARLIADYGIFELDLARHVTPLGQNATVLPKNLESWKKARPVGRVEQLTRDEAHLTPDSNKEFNNWHAFYPSAAHRMQLAANLATVLPGETGRPNENGRTGPWYTARESIVQFAARHPRLRVFPEVPEDALADLLLKGLPNRLRVRVRARPGSRASELFRFGWTIPTPTLIPTQPYFGADEFTAHDVVLGDGSTWLTLVLTQIGELRAAKLRHALLSLAFVAFPDRLGDAGALESWRKDPDQLDGLEVELVAERAPFANGEGIRTGEVALDLDLRSPVHPFLEDLLGALAYHTNPDGEWYRKYEVLI